MRKTISVILALALGTSAFAQDSGLGATVAAQDGVSGPSMSVAGPDGVSGPSMSVAGQDGVSGLSMSVAGQDGGFGLGVGAALAGGYNTAWGAYAGADVVARATAGSTWRPRRCSRV